MSRRDESRMHVAGSTDEMICGTARLSPHVNPPVVFFSERTHQTLRQVTKLGPYNPNLIIYVLLVSSRVLVRCVQ